MNNDENTTGENLVWNLSKMPAKLALDKEYNQQQAEDLVHNL
jgi:hypothetical protein